jgi:hypothetical protein
MPELAGMEELEFFVLKGQYHKIIDRRAQHHAGAGRHGRTGNFLLKGIGHRAVVPKNNLQKTPRVKAQTF